MTCCEKMKYAMSLERVKRSQYDNEWYVWCEDCGKHEGDPIYFCHFCGTKLP